MNGVASARAPLIMLGMLALFSGATAGLRRLGLFADVGAPGLESMHAPLMIGGFFGALIGVERAVALGARWAFLAPLLAGVATVMWLAGAPWPWGACAVTASSLLFLVVNFFVILRQPSAHTAVMALGAACWLAGNALWASGRTIPDVTAAWAAFLVLTILAERLELSRLMPRTPARSPTFVAIALLMCVSAGLSVVGPDATRLFGATLVASAVWLARFDVARRTVRSHGLTRFVAVALLSGYAWLALSGAIAMTATPLPAGEVRDAFIHALMLGFVFSMVIGHAPLIFPAILRVSMPFHAVMYLPLLVLDVTLLARLAADAASSPPARQAAGVASLVALVLFVVVNVSRIIAGRRECGAP